MPQLYNYVFVKDRTFEFFFYCKMSLSLPGILERGIFCTSVFPSFFLLFFFFHQNRPFPNLLRNHQLNIAFDFYKKWISDCMPTIAVRNYWNNCEKRYCSGIHEQCKTLFRDHIIIIINLFKVDNCTNRINKLTL